jgi:hypothetical protein
VINGERVIAVTGTVMNLGAEEHVFAFAGPKAGLPPWWPSDPATISGIRWKAYIKHLPSSGKYYSVWAGTAQLPPSCPSGTDCLIRLRYIEGDLALKGPQSRSLLNVTRPHSVVLPSPGR